MTTIDRDESILALFKQGNSRGHIAAIVACHQSTVSRVLKRHGIEPAWVHDPDEQGDPPRPGEPTMKKGDCLICKKGTFTHPHWPDGKCPTCGGTRRYPNVVMKPVQRWKCPECGHILQVRYDTEKIPARCTVCHRRVEMEEA